MAKLVKDPFANATYVKVAMRMAYNGRPYNGIEMILDKNQPHTTTIEAKLFAAMHKSSMIKDPLSPYKDIDYSKAGRTDAGVSASCNVISVRVRRLCGTQKIKQMMLQSLPA